MHPPDRAPEKGKAHSPECLAAEGLGLSEQSELGTRLKRYGTAKNRSHQMAGHALASGSRDLSRRLYACGAYLRFRHYLAHQRTVLVESRSCDLSLLCPLCAIRRGGRLLRRYVERVEHLSGTHDFDAITLTVKNGDDLAERFAHLKSSFQRLRNRAKKGYGAFSEVSGALWSVELTKSGYGWHPHVHLIAARPKGSPPLRYGEGSQLAADWQLATGDSFIVHSQRIRAEEDGGIVAALCETLKYALKFGDLDLADNFDAYWILRGKRLCASSGVFFGLELPDEPLDDDPLDGPFIELLFRYAGSRGYVFASPERLPTELQSIQQEAPHGHEATP